MTSFQSSSLSATDAITEVSTYAMLTTCCGLPGTVRQRRGVGRLQRLAAMGYLNGPAPRVVRALLTCLPPSVSSQLVVSPPTRLTQAPKAWLCCIVLGVRSHWHRAPGVLTPGCRCSLTQRSTRRYYPHSFVDLLTYRVGRCSLEECDAGGGAGLADTLPGLP